MLTLAGVYGTEVFFSVLVSTSSFPPFDIHFPIYLTFTSNFHMWDEYKFTHLAGLPTKNNKKVPFIKAGHTLRYDLVWSGLVLFRISVFVSMFESLFKSRSFV